MILQEDDSRLQEIIALMNVHGVPLLPNDTQSRDIERSPIGYYQSQRIRGFDDSDFKSAEYLWLQELDGSGSDVDADGDRHADGLLPIMMNTVPRRGRLMSCGTDVFLVSDVFRSELEAERFAGGLARLTGTIAARSHCRIATPDSLSWRHPHPSPG